MLPTKKVALLFFCHPNARMVIVPKIESNQPTSPKEHNQHRPPKGGGITIKLMILLLLAMSMATYLIGSRFCIASRPEQQRQLQLMEQHVTATLTSSTAIRSQLQPQRQPQSQETNKQDDIPLVIICALRPNYLEQLLQSVEDQVSTTPEWIGKQRYLFIHRHEKNYHRVHNNETYQQVQELAKQHNLQIHVFNGLHLPTAKLNVNANYVWYKMMKYLFMTLQIEEALIAEEDIIIAPDALLMASKLFLEKKQRNDVHSIILGGWSGENRINANPYTYLAVRSEYFQAMFYSMNVTLFQQIESQKKHTMLYGMRPDMHNVDDWTEEITERQFITNLTQLTPSIGRMYHIGAIGMGKSGAGDQIRTIKTYKPWDYWNQTIGTDNRTLEDYFLEPIQVTDIYGFICQPIVPRCGHDHFRQDINLLSATTILNRTRSMHELIQASQLPSNSDALDPIIPIVNVQASSIEEGMAAGAPYAIDQDLKTRWSSKLQQDPQWLMLDLGQPYDISSIEIYWEYAYSTKYQIQIATSSPSTNDNNTTKIMTMRRKRRRMDWKTIYAAESGTGYYPDFINLTSTTATTSSNTTSSCRYIQWLGMERRYPQLGYSMWEIIIRGTLASSSSGIDIDVKVLHL